MAFCREKFEETPAPRQMCKEVADIYKNKFSLNTTPVDDLILGFPAPELWEIYLHCLWIIPNMKFW